MKECEFCRKPAALRTKNRRHFYCMRCGMAVQSEAFDQCGRVITMLVIENEEG